MAALGRMVRLAVTVSAIRLPFRSLGAATWTDACDFTVPEVRIAASVASIYTWGIGSLSDNLSRVYGGFSWMGPDLAGRMVAVLEKRLQLANAAETELNPLGGACRLHPGDVTRFIEGSVDDTLIEDLIFAFATLDWAGFKAPDTAFDLREVVATYAVIKHLFLPQEINRGPEPKRIRADPRVLSLLKAGNVSEAAATAVGRLRVAGFRPLTVDYAGGMDSRRLAASLLIPVWVGAVLGAGIFHEKEEDK